MTTPTKASFAMLGDQAILVRLPDEASAFGFTSAVREADWPWLIDLVPAYTSVAVFFDPMKISLAYVMQLLSQLPSESQSPREGKCHRIPCCYEMERDLKRVADFHGVSTEEVIRLHTSTEFTIYAIGFAPGFPYLGYLPDALSGVPRLPSPRLRVEPGSIGLTGRQTGIYPLERPGGWNLIGRTPCTIVDIESDYFPLCVGDRVIFQRIDTQEFHQRLGERIAED